MVNHSNSQEQLDKSVEEILASEEALSHAANGEDPLLRGAARLTKSVPPAFPEDAQSRILELVLEAHSTASEPEKKKQMPRRIWFPHGLVPRVAAVFLLFLLASLLTISATGNSLPDDIFYPIKRQFEVIEERLATTPLAQAEVHLTQANRRIHEAERLLESGGLDISLLEDALTSMNSAITIAQDNELFESHTDLQQRTLIVFDVYTTFFQRVHDLGLLAPTDESRLYSLAEDVTDDVDFLSLQPLNEGTPSAPGDFGCPTPGNACNAPGRNNSNGRANGP